MHTKTCLLTQHGKAALSVGDPAQRHSTELHASTQPMVQSCTTVPRDHALSGWWWGVPHCSFSCTVPERHLMIFQTTENLSCNYLPCCHSTRIYFHGRSFHQTRKNTQKPTHKTHAPAQSSLKPPVNCRLTVPLVNLSQQLNCTHC